MAILFYKTQPAKNLYAKNYMQDANNLPNKPIFFERLFVIFSFLILSGPLVFLFPQEEGVISDPSLGDLRMQIIYASIYVVPPIILFANKIKISHAILRGKLLLALVFLAILSIFWSDFPLLTMRRSLALIGTTLFGIYVALRFSLAKQIKLLAWALGISAILSLVTALLFPDYGQSTIVYEAGCRGIYVHRSILGRLMVLNVLTLLFLKVKNRKSIFVKGIFIALSMILIFFSGSVGPVIILVSLITFLPIFQAFKWSKNLRIAFLVLVLLLACWTILWFCINFNPFLNAIGRDPTLTGRTDLWKGLLPVIIERPFFGYGYSAFWVWSNYRISHIRWISGWEAQHSHNGFLEILLSLGIAGGAMFAAHYILAFQRAIIKIQSGKKAEIIWAIVYLTFMLLSNLSESTILRQNSLFWVIYVSTTVSLSLFSENFKHKV